MAAAMVRFVRIIEQYPCLYNNTIADYSIKDKTDQAWSEVAEKTNTSVSDCQTKWKNIRNGFVRSLKPVAIGAKQKKLYYLHDELQFILPFIKAVIYTDEMGYISTPPQVMIDNISEESNSLSEEENISENVSNTVKRMKKRKSSKEADKECEDCIKTKIPKEDNARRMFLLSLLPDVDSLSDEQMRNFRIKVLLLLEEVRTGSSQQQIVFGIS